MKKAFFAVLLTILAAFFVAGCSKETGSTDGSDKGTGIQAEEIRVATQPGPQMAPILVVKHKGWLEDELAKVGVAVKWTSFLSGPPMNESFAAGEQDIGFLGDSAAIIPRSEGQDLRVVGVAGTAAKGLAIVVPKDSAITSPKQLKGKKVAAVKGSYGHHLLALVLQNNGLTTDDIEFLNFSTADSATALINKNIEAAAIWEPLLTRLLDQGAIRVLVDGTGIKQGLLVIVAENDFAKQNPELVKTFLKAYQRGIDYLETNPQEAAELIADEIKLEPEQFLKVLGKFEYNPAIHADDIAELKKSEAFMLEAGITRKSVDIDAFIDSSYAVGAGFK